MTQKLQSAYNREESIEVRRQQSFNPQQAAIDSNYQPIVVRG